MKTTSSQTHYSKYTFRDFTGYIVAPWISGVTHKVVTIRHSASVEPWIDRDIHLHSDSEEYYFLFRGKLELLVDGSMLTLRPYEVLSVRPETPHAVVGGDGPIEHFVIRMPALDDRQITGKIPAGPFLVTNEVKRDVQLDWGCRVPLKETWFQNCWLFGVGQARFHSDHRCLA